MDSPFNFGSGFKSLPERLVGERAERMEQRKNVLSFGIGFLDSALGGICQTDLILVGAKMGQGKTALATIIASASVCAGKKVHYFGLEAEEREIERRLKYQVLSELMHKQNGKYVDFERMNYLDWYRGDLDDMTGPFEDEADSLLMGKYATLHTYYRTSDFDAEMLGKQLLAVQDETSLAIIDHFHYIDSNDDNENRGHKTTAKLIRDTALSMRKPVIVIAHVRKGERKGAPLVPGIEEFHGSSDLPKMATKAVMLAWAFDQPNSQNYLWNTYCAVGKCRLDGSRTRYVGLVEYDSRRGQYVESFTLGNLINNGEKFVHLPWEKWPRWAKGNNHHDQSKKSEPTQGSWYDR